MAETRQRQPGDVAREFTSELWSNGAGGSGVKSHVLLGKFWYISRVKRLHGLSFPVIPTMVGKTDGEGPLWPLKTADDGPDGKGGLR